MPGVAVACGHFRNGILLAPVTAAAVVDLVNAAEAAAAAEAREARVPGQRP